MRPQVINVFGKSYKIEYKEMDELHGECHNTRATIEIEQSQEGKELIHTLLHEYFHAVIYRVGLGQVLHGDIEEIICETFATFLVDNGLVKEKDNVL